MKCVECGLVDNHYLTCPSSKYSAEIGIVSVDKNKRYEERIRELEQENAALLVHEHNYQDAIHNIARCCMDLGTDTEALRSKLERAEKALDEYRNRDNWEAHVGHHLSTWTADVDGPFVADAYFEEKESRSEQATSQGSHEV